MRSVVGAVLLAYSLLPTLGTLHQTRHHGEIGFGAGATHVSFAAADAACGDSTESCEICQSAARSKHACGALAEIASYRDDAARLRIHTSRVCYAADASALPPARAPPLA